jgi:hypothetical protein
VTTPRPRVDPRRQPEIFAELRERAGVALPGRSPVDADKDWIAALLQIAARLSSEVTRRLDRVPQKNVHNFFDWIGVRGRAARAARLVAIFRRAPKAGPLIIQSRVRLQASTDDAPVIFETEQDLRILPGNLQTLVAVDSTADQIYLPPPGLLDPTVIAPPAIARKLKSLAAAGSDTIQVTPAVELAKADVLAVGGQQYRVSEVTGSQALRRSRARRVLRRLRRPLRPAARRRRAPARLLETSRPRPPRATGRSTRSISATTTC